MVALSQYTFLKSLTGEYGNLFHFFVLVFYFLRVVVFPCWLRQIGHLLYDSNEYQDVELKNVIEIN